MAYRSVQYDDEHYELVLIDRSANKKLLLAGIYFFAVLLLIILFTGYLEGVFEREERLLQCRADPKSLACKEIFDSMIKLPQQTK